ncbi:hypothetical protein C1646_662361 [Rhizophagus diaphanus]|nr:hypothetical protein C1646_662361 [Rhizophagus diaphanus] [Rhizophagus sp. MUCL 43196]
MDRFTDIKEIGESGFVKIYSATWIDDESNHRKNDDGGWKKRKTGSKRVALKSLGVIMENHLFYNKKHDLSLTLAICNGLRPEFGKGTPGFYKKLAYTVDVGIVLLDVVMVKWKNSVYKGREIKAAFEDSDKEIPNISTLYEKNSDAIYISRAYTFSNLLPKSVNSSIMLIMKFVTQKSKPIK